MALLFKNNPYCCPVLKACQYRLYPTPSQAGLINKPIGSCRFVYHLALEVKQMAYAGNRVNLSCVDLIKQLPDLKKECGWLKEINSQSLQAAIVNLDTAFTKFFKGPADLPNCKKKTEKQSFSIPQNVVVENAALLIPKFKQGVALILHRPLKGVLRQATISRTPTGKYFVSILCATGEAVKKPKPVKETTTVGIDLGIKPFLVTSDGGAFDNPAFLKKSLSRLPFVGRNYSKHKGKRTRQKLARLHEKVANGGTFCTKHQQS